MAHAAHRQHRVDPFDTTWSISGANSGSVAVNGFDAIAFSGIANLTGAADNEDTFVFESAGSLSGSIDGGANGFDSLVIEGGSYDLVVSTVTGPQSGYIELDSQFIDYSGLEPIASSGTAAAIIFNLPSTGSNTLSLGAGAAGKLKLTSDNSTFETTTFAVPTTSLIINLGSVGDVLTINKLDPTFNVALTITGLAWSRCTSPCQDGQWGLDDR
jgi:hypothetical protein